MSACSRVSSSKQGWARGQRARHILRMDGHSGKWDQLSPCSVPQPNGHAEFGPLNLPVVVHALHADLSMEDTTTWGSTFRMQNMWPRILLDASIVIGIPIIAEALRAMARSANSMLNSLRSSLTTHACTPLPTGGGAANRPASEARVSLMWPTTPARVHSLRKGERLQYLERRVRRCSATTRSSAADA